MLYAYSLNDLAKMMLIRQKILMYFSHIRVNYQVRDDFLTLQSIIPDKISTLVMFMKCIF